MTHVRNITRSPCVCLLEAGFAAVMTILVLGMACSGGNSGERRTFFSIGTGGTGGIYYPLGGAIASRLSLSDTLRQYTAEVTGGGVENVNRLRSGEIDLGFAPAMTVYEAFHGGPDYAAPVDRLRIVAPLYANMTHIMVPRGSTLRSLSDLRGRRVAVGAPGSGTEQLSRQLLEAHGLTYDDVQPRYLSFSESSAAIRDGAVDAAILSVGYPASAVLEATTTGGARLLSVEDGRIDALQARHPFYARGTIPGGTYPGVEEDVVTVAALSWVVALEDLDGSVVHLLLDLLQDDLQSLVQVHEIASQIDLESLRAAPIPLHSASRAWLAAAR